MRKPLIALMLVLLLMTAFAAAAEENSLKFDQNINTLCEGETLQTVLKRTGEAAEGTVTYKSSDKKKATVDENGVVTGLSKGQVSITATVKGASRTYKAELAVVVYRKAETIEVNTGRLNLFEPTDPLIMNALGQQTELPVLIVPMNKDFELKANVLPAGASNRRTVMESADEAILQTKGARIRGVAAGETELTIANELSPEVNVRYRILVVKPVTKIKLTAENASVPVDGTMALSAEITPADAGFPYLSWKSTDESHVIVDDNGKVTGVKRGGGKVVATALDGSNARAEISVKVTQSASGIVLNSAELTIDTGKSHTLKATVLPENTNNKKVVWYSTDTSVAQVNANGRVTGVSVGTCEIICSSQDNPAVSASATVQVQQPVTKIVFDEKEASVYLGKICVLSWSVEPANATNPAVRLTSSNENILTVSDDGTVTPVKHGEATVTAMSTDGSNRKARIKVKVLQPVEGVHMEHTIAYIEPGEKASVRAVLEPSYASNHYMTWGSVNPDIVTVTGEKTTATITGQRNGYATIIGTTEDGGFQTSFTVNVGDWDSVVIFRSFDIGGKANPLIEVRNVGDVSISHITVQLTYYDENGDPYPINSKNGSNVINAVYRKTLAPGKTTSSENNWELVNYETPEEPFARVTAKLISYRLDGWTKNIRKKNQQTKTYNRSW